MSQALVVLSMLCVVAAIFCFVMAEVHRHRARQHADDLIEMLRYNPTEIPYVKERALQFSTPWATTMLLDRIEKLEQELATAG